MGRIDLVTGGARSGKSTFAERVAADRSRVVYVATAAAGDAEMADRIARHRARRPAAWTTVEAADDGPAAAAAALVDADMVILDCLSVWAANRLLGLGDPEADGWWDRVAVLEGELSAELGDALASARGAGGDLVLVTNEVGLGVVPASPLGRAYRDLLGRLNQAAAAAADRVVLVMLGIAVDLRSLGDGASSPPPRSP